MEADKKKVEMEYRYLGRSGLKVSVLSFGAWITQGSQINDDTAFECMKAAYDAGCNFFDNAEVYGGGEAEVTMGKILKRLNIPRSELVISTKIFWGGKGANQRGLSRKHIVEGVNAALARLQLDYVDLVFCHRPDPHTPMEEIVRSMDWVINSGKAFYWGTSEWPADQIIQAVEVAKRLHLIAPIMEQPQYSMLHRTRFEKEYGRLYREIGLGTTIWSPLACGLLTGKYSGDPSTWKDSRLAFEEQTNKHQWLREQLLGGKGMNGLEETNLDAILRKVDGLRPIAEKLDCSLAQLAIAWCLKNPNVSTVITGASRASQVVENFAALQVLPKLTEQVLGEIETILGNKPESPKDWRTF